MKVFARKIIFVLSAFIVCASVCLAACSEDSNYIDMSKLTEEEAIAQYGYYVIDNDGSKSYTTGDEVHFGSYPQSEVTDESIIASLTAQQGVLPTESDAGDWTSYDGYSSCNLYYKDVTLEDGNTYRGVLSDTYEVSWFKFEPMTWTILSCEDGTAYIFALHTYDCQAFQKDDALATNDWSQSSLRTYLNTVFLSEAFTQAQQELIVETTLDNATTSYKESAGEGLASTTDKIFLPSYQDMINEDYGFPSVTAWHLQSLVGIENLNNLEYGGEYGEMIIQSMIRRRGVTDYTVAQGCGTSDQCHSIYGERACVYLLRSAGMNGCCTNGDKFGELSYVSVSSGLWYGVVPALNIKIGK